MFLNCLSKWKQNTQSDDQIIVSALHFSCLSKHGRRDGDKDGETEGRAVTVCFHGDVTEQ